jgi:hypothetical protein
MSDPKKKEEPERSQPEAPKTSKLPEPDKKLANYLKGSQDNTDRENHVVSLEE